jgi:hypothetical protein
MPSEEDIKNSECVLFLRKRLYGIYRECKEKNDYSRLATELFYLIPKSISLDFYPEDDRVGFYKFLEFIITKMRPESE